jgi:trans-2,3-dihydro-3-hydroxyanthranilate isomerase
MGMTVNYSVVDVFTQTRFEGNPLAVFPQADDFDDGLMQRIARELNLSETSFVQTAASDGAVARVRIFTPTMEMRFAGHPTIGTAYVLWRAGRVGTGSDVSFTFEELVGPVGVRIGAPADDPIIWLTTPPIALGRIVDRDKAAQAASLDSADLIDDVSPQLLSAGNPTIYIAVGSRDAVDRAWVDTSTSRSVFEPDEQPCICVFAPTDFGAYTRVFVAEHGILEDPATGSATGPLALFMLRNSLITQTRFYSEQGTKMGRRSILHVNVEGGVNDDSIRIEVGGQVRHVADASMTIS